MEEDNGLCVNDKDGKIVVLEAKPYMHNKLLLPDLLSPLLKCIGHELTLLLMLQVNQGIHKWALDQDITKGLQ